MEDSHLRLRGTCIRLVFWLPFFATALLVVIPPQSGHEVHTTLASLGIGTLPFWYFLRLALGSRLGSAAMRRRDASHWLLRYRALRWTLASLGWFFLLVSPEIESLIHHPAGMEVQMWAWIAMIPYGLPLVTFLIFPGSPPRNG